MYALAKDDRGFHFVKLLFLSIVISLYAYPSHSRETVAEILVNGRPAIVYDDGFWRYTDDIGEICTPTGSFGSVCAMPSSWSRMPLFDELRYGLPEFVQGEFIGEFRVLQHYGDGQLTEDDVIAYIANRTIYDGLRGTVILKEPRMFGVLPATHIVISAGPYGVFAFTFADQNGRFLIAQTRDQDTTIYPSGHRAAHNSFVDAIRPKPFE